jgi:type VI secretion system protein ImpK
LLANTGEVRPNMTEQESAHFGDENSLGILDVKDATSQIDTPTDLKERLEAIKLARNPLLEASTVLLRALSDMPTEISGEKEIKLFHALLVQELQNYTRLCDQVNIRRDHMLAVRYALCTALDESARQTNWGGGNELDAGYWSNNALLYTFHQEGDGGRVVFLLIGRLAVNPQEHLPVLEVMMNILGLGFQGHYRTVSDGNRTLETIRHRLYTTVTSAYESNSRELSPHWQGEHGKFRLLRSIPVWVAAVTFSLIAFLLFAWYKYQLSFHSEQIEKEIKVIGELQPPYQKSLRLKELLSTEIAAGKVSVVETSTESRLTFKGDDMFLPGKAEINQKAIETLLKVSSGIQEIKGHVKIVGHSDSQPIRSTDFPNNQVLSEKRAQAVAQALITNGVSNSDITTVGFGDTQPLASNKTADGRSRNRRVEITVFDK